MQILLGNKGNKTPSSLFLPRNLWSADWRVFMAPCSRRFPLLPSRAWKRHPAPCELLQNEKKSPQTSLLLSLMRSGDHGVIIYIHVSFGLRSTVPWLSGYTYPPPRASGGRRSLALGCSMGATSALWTGLGWPEVVLVFLGAVGRSEAAQKK